MKAFIFSLLTLMAGGALAAPPPGIVFGFGFERAGPKGNFLNWCAGTAGCLGVFGHKAPPPPDSPGTVPGLGGNVLALDSSKRQYVDAFCDPALYVDKVCTGGGAAGAAARMALNVNRWTQSAWIRPTANPVPDTRWEIMEKAGAYWMNIRTDTRQLRVGGIFGACSGAGSKWIYADSVPAVPLNTWTHVAATYNGTVLKVFINGQPVQVRAQGVGAPRASVPATGVTCANTQPLTIGVKHNLDSGFAAWFTGNLDDVALFNRALTGAEIRSFLSAPLP